MSPPIYPLARLRAVWEKVKCVLQSVVAGETQALLKTGQSAANWVRDSAYPHTIAAPWAILRTPCQYRHVYIYFLSHYSQIYYAAAEI